MTTPQNLYKLNLNLTAIEVAQIGWALKARIDALQTAINTEDQPTMIADLADRLKATNTAANKIEEALGDPF